MSRREQLNLIARRQLDSIGQSSGLRYVSDRAEIIRQSKALIVDLELEEDVDIMSIVEVARFLAGDTVEGS